MRKRLFGGKGLLYRRTARALAMLLLAGELIPAMPLLTAFAIPTESAGDVWEQLEAQGEVMISYPGTIRSTISFADDVDLFGFQLKGETDLTVILDGEGCILELYQGEECIGSSSLPYSQSIEKRGLEAGTYQVRVLAAEGTKEAAYSLRLQDQSARKKTPDYSEAHLSGTMYDRKSPFRMRDLSDDDRDQSELPYPKRAPASVQGIGGVRGALEERHHDVWSSVQRLPDEQGEGLPERCRLHMAVHAA